MIKSYKYLSAITVLLLSGSNFIKAQGFDPSTSIDAPTSVSHGTGLEHVDLMSGGLVINLPLLHLKGRGLDTDVVATYSSKVWSTQYLPDQYGSFPAMVIENFGQSSGFNGWTVGMSGFLSGAGTGTVACPDPNTCLGGLVDLTQFYQIGGSSISLTNGATFTNNYPTDWPLVSYDGTYVKSSNDQHTLYFKDGHTLRSSGNELWNVLEDTNGNNISCLGTTCTDTVGRQIVFNPIHNPGSPGTSPTTSVSYLDDNGTMQTISFTYSTFSLKYPWTQGDIPCGTPNNQSGSCVIDDAAYSPLLLTAVTLPNNTQYKFEYADNGDGTTSGELSKLTYPTGGYVRYVYTNLDPTVSELIASNRRIIDRYVSPDGTAASEQHWNYGQEAVVTNYLVSPGACGPVTDPQGNIHSEHFSEFAYGQWYAGNCVEGNNPLDGPAFFPPVSVVPVPTYSEDRTSTGTLLQSNTKTYVFDSSNYTVFSSAYGGVPANMGVNNPRIASETNVMGGSSNQKVTSYTYGTYGNISSKSYYDWGPAGALGVLLKTEIYSYLVDQNILYAADGVHILDRRTSDTISGNCGGVVSTCSVTSSIYDQYGSGRLALGLAATSSVIQHDDLNYSSSNTMRGNVTQTIGGNGNHGGSATIDRAYSDLGNVAATMDGNGYTTTYTYTDSYFGPQSLQATQAFVTQVNKPTTGGIQHIEKGQYYLYSGLIAAHCGENFVGNTCAAQLGSQSDYTWMSYDSLNRAIGQYHGDGGSTTLLYSEAPLNTSATLTKAINSSQNEVSVSTYDGLGRQLQTKLSSDPAGVTYVDRTYDQLGQLHSISNPYRSPAAVGDPPLGTTYYAYDAIGRKTSQTQQDGSILQWCYNGLQTSGQTNCLGNQSSNPTASWIDISGESGTRVQQVFDGLGRLLAVKEQNPNGAGLAAETDYNYDAMGNLLEAVQNGVASETPRIRNFTYDSLSRLVCSSNPENSTTSCPSSATVTMPLGVNSYAYDYNSNLTAEIDARGVTSSYVYDVLNRNLSRTASDGTVHDTFIYDNANGYAGYSSPCTNGIGRVCNADHPGFAGTFFNYDPMGRVTSTAYANAASSNPYTLGMQAAYDLAGNITQLTYPDGRQIIQIHDSADRLAKVSAPASGGTSAFDYISGTTTLSNTGPTATGGITYTPSGAEQSFYLGSNIIQSASFNSRLQPCQTLVGMAIAGMTQPQTIVERRYFHNSTPETLCQNASQNNGNIWSIADNLRSGWTQSFGYDSLNRLTSASRADNGYSYQYSLDSFGNMKPVDQINTPINYSIDPATNRMQRNTADFQYDASGNLTSSADSPSPNSYQYTADNQVVSVNSGSTATYGYNGMGEREYKLVGGGWTEYIYFNGQPMAEHTADGVWTDYIYANGRKIAKTTSSDTRLHASGTTVQSGYELGATLPIPSNYVVKIGDTISWRQYNLGVVGGINVQFTNGTQTAWHTTDYEGEGINQDYIQDGWQYRTALLNDFYGDTISSIAVLKDVNTAIGSWSMYIADISILSVDGAVTPIYVGQSSPTSVQPVDSAYDTSFNVASETVPLSSDPTYSGSSAYTTKYYLSDQVNTVQMELASGGWPVWQEHLMPFGGVVPDQTANQPTDNHYKFTGKERDAESGLDYFGARYYSSSVGRWMSPDWAAKAEPVPYAKLDNPQSLNLYAYVENNPLNSIDLDGHSGNGDCGDDCHPPSSGHDDRWYQTTWSPGRSGGASNFLAPDGEAQQHGDSANPVQVGMEWLTGKGPRNHTFRDGDPFTEILRHHSHVQEVLAGIRDGSLPPNGSNNYDIGGVNGVGHYLADYSLVLTLGATGNLAATYLGSYKMSYTTDKGAITFVVTNSSTLGSATHLPIVGYTAVGQRFSQYMTGLRGSGAMSKTTQTFIFHEQLTP